MELYVIVAYVSGLISGVAVFYFGFKLGYAALYRKSHDIPFEQNEDGFDQEVTD